MAPAIVTLDTTPDFDFSPAFTTTTPKSAQQNGTKPTGQRTLLLATPSLASNETGLRVAMAGYDRSTSDLHMLDRLAAGFVNLPHDTYDLVLLLTGGESVDALLDRALLTRVHDALKAGGKVETQGGVEIGSGVDKEFVLAGLVRSGSGFSKPDYGAETVVPLKLRKKKLQVASGEVVPQQLKVEVKKEEEVKKVPNGVGFVTLDDLDGDDGDDDLIDEDTLLTPQDLKRPLNIRMFLSKTTILLSLNHFIFFTT